MRMAFKTVKEIENWRPTNPNGEQKNVDGAKGLYVKGQPSGSKTYYTRKNNRWIYIGSIQRVKLSAARQLATAADLAIERGVDPKLVSSALKAVQGNSIDFNPYLNGLVEQFNKPLGSSKTVDELMKEWLPKKEANLTAGPSRRRPRSLYELHFQDEFGELKLDELKRSDLHVLFEEDMKDKPETASRLRAILAEAMNYAVSKDFILDNPIPEARRLLLSKPKVQSHKTIEHDALPILWKDIESSSSSPSTKALLLVGMTTGLRFSSIRNVRANNLNLGTGLWTIPEAKGIDGEYRIKSGKEFRLKLPPVLLNELKKLLGQKFNSYEADDFIFYSPTKVGHPVSETAVRKCLKGTGHDLVFHGFRNAIKIWGRSEELPDWLMDAYCQHAPKGLDRSYRRADYLEERYEVTKKLTSFVLGIDEKPD